MQPTTIYEKFAVGQVAVGSGAAKMLFAPKTMKLEPAVFSPELKLTRTKIRELAPPKSEKEKKAIEWIKSNYTSFATRKYPMDDFLSSPPSNEALEKLLQFLEAG